MGMYVWESYKGASVMTRVALSLMSTSLYLGWYSFCTNGWGHRFPYNDTDIFLGYGLWRVGENKVFNPVILHTDGWPITWYGTFQAFASLGFICLNTGYVLTILLVFVGPCKANRELAFFDGITNITGVCWLIAVVLFAMQFATTFNSPTDVDSPILQYSFFLAVAVTALEMLAGVLLLLTRRSSPQVA